MLRPAAKVLAGPQGDSLGAFRRYHFHDGPFAVAATVVCLSLRVGAKKTFDHYRQENRETAKSQKRVKE